MNPLYPATAIALAAAALASREAGRAAPRRDGSLKQFYGANMHYELAKYTQVVNGLAQYGVSYSDHAKWGINPRAKYAPTGVWFYYLDPECRSGVGSGFATDRRWANVAKLNNSRLMILKQGHPQNTPNGKQVIEAIADRVGGLDKAAFNKAFRRAGFSGIVDYDRTVLPVEQCQGVITWPDGASYVTSFPRTSRPADNRYSAISWNQRLASMMKNLRYRRPGTLNLTRDQIQQVVRMLPQFYHRWDVSDSRADLYAHLLRALNFTHADSWQWAEERLDGREHLLYDALEPNPTTPRAFWEQLRYARDEGARLTAQDVLRSRRVAR